MSHRYYGVCRANIGRVCHITTRDGRRLSGRIVGVTPSGVRLVPLGERISDEHESESPITLGSHTVDTEGKNKGQEVFFFFPFFIPFVAITALAFASGFGSGFRRGFRRGFFY